MTTTVRVLLVTLLVGIPAFMLAPAAPLGQTIWPPPVDLTPPPTPTQVKLLMLLGALEAGALGLGVSFVILGWPLVRQVAAPRRGRALAMYLAIAWLLTNWWVHDGFHMVTGMDPRGLVWIEYGFHVTLIVAGAALAYCFATMGWEESTRKAAA